MQAAIVLEHTDQYKDYTARIVRQVMSRYGVPPKYFSEYIGAAYTGLLEAAERYDPETGVPFEKYAYLRVRGAIIDYIRETTGETGKAQQAYKLLQSFDCLTDDFKQIRPNLNIGDSDRALAEVLDHAAKGALIFRLVYCESEEDVIECQEEQKTPELQAVDKQIQNQLLQSIDILPLREKEIIYLYYYQDYSFQMIADHLHVTRSWVSRMHSRAIRMLRVALEQAFSVEIEE